MVKFGRCCICTISFTIADVCSLRCGHTFHTECISQWIKNSKTCPTCRRRTVSRDIVRLFFDEADLSFSQAPSATNHENMVDELMAQLTAEKENTRKLLTTSEEFQNELRSLRSQLKQEKKKADTAALKDHKIKALEKMLHSQLDMENELKVWKARVKASEFFRYLMRKDDNESAIDNFLTNSGDVDNKKFFEIIRKQRKNLEMQIKDLNSQIINIKRENAELAAKNKKFKQLLVDFKQENNNLKKSSAISVNGSPAFEDVNDFDNSFITSTRPKKSFGFSFAEESLNATELLNSARKSAKPLECTSRNLQNINDFFSDDENEECTSSGLLSHNGNTENTKGYLTTSVELDVPIMRGLFNNDKANREKIVPKRRVSTRPSDFARSIAILDELEIQECGLSNSLQKKKKLSSKNDRSLAKNRE